MGLNGIKLGGNIGLALWPKSCSGCIWSFHLFCLIIHDFPSDWLYVTDKSSRAKRAVQGMRSLLIAYCQFIRNYPLEVMSKVCVPSGEWGWGRGMLSARVGGGMVAYPCLKTVPSCCCHNCHYHHHNVVCPPWLSTSMVVLNCVLLPML